MLYRNFQNLKHKILQSGGVFNDSDIDLLQNQNELSTSYCKYHCSHLVEFLMKYTNKKCNRQQANRQMGNNLQLFSEAQMLKTTYVKHAQISE